MKDEIRTFILDNILMDSDEIKLEDNENFMEKGYVNSLFSIKLINFIENTFLVKIDYEDMDVINFSSVDNILNFITKKQNQ